MDNFGKLASLDTRTLYRYSKPAGSEKKRPSLKGPAYPTPAVPGTVQGANHEDSLGLEQEENKAPLTQMEMMDSAKQYKLDDANNNQNNVGLYLSPGLDNGYFRASPGSNPSMVPLEGGATPDSLKVISGFRPKVRKESDWFSPDNHNSLGQPQQTPSVSDSHPLAPPSHFAPPCPTPAQPSQYAPPSAAPTDMYHYPPPQQYYMPTQSQIYQTTSPPMPAEAYTTPLPPPAQQHLIVSLPAPAEPMCKTASKVESSSSDANANPPTLNSNPDEESDESKKTKQERNRLCARECRKRKKQYIETLEKQVKDLKDELEACKKELDLVKQKDSAGFGILDEANKIKEACMQKIHEVLQNQAATNEEITKTIKDLLTNFGIGSQKRKDAIDMMVQKTLELFLPTPMRYLLWAATENNSLFNLSGFAKKKPKKNYKYVIFEQQAHLSDDWNEIWNHIELSEKKRKALLDIKPALCDFKYRISQKVKDLLQLKDSILNDISVLYDYVQNNLISKFPVDEVGRAIIWINMKKQKLELSDANIYGLSQTIIMKPPALGERVPLTGMMAPQIKAESERLGGL